MGRTRVAVAVLWVFGTACNSTKSEPTPSEQIREAPSVSPAEGEGRREPGERPADPPDTPPVRTSERTIAPPPNDTGEPGAATGTRKAEATFQSAEGVSLKGRATFVEVPDGVRIEVEVQDAPSGLHGIHIHEKPDCSDIPGKSMGGHFAPDDHAHALPNEPKRHLGDLGNIEIDKQGRGKHEITIAKANLRPGDSHSFVGRALVIHEGRDTGKGESGEAGKPIACALIESQ